MCQKIFSFVLSFVLLMLLCTGCIGKPASGGGASAPSPEPSFSEELTPEVQSAYRQYLEPLLENGALMNNWTGDPQGIESGDLYGAAKDLEIVDALLEEDGLTLTAEVYGVVLRNPETGEETITNGDWVVENAVAVQTPYDSPHFPYIPLGAAAVKMQDPALEPVPAYLSCVWEPYENPGRRYLEARTAELSDQMAASERPDLSGYDRRLVDYVYKIIASQRLIGGPEDITLWDLENLCTDLSINWEVVNYVPETIADPMEPPPIDAGLLRLMPNLRSFTTYYPLADYGVFGEMKQLESLRFDIEAAETPLDFSTLRVGKADTLSIDGFRQDIAIDLSGCDVNTLHINSWVASVTELKGCEGIKNLEFNNTRSDTRIISAEAFPNAEHIRMAFFSDTPRVRDFSRLASFGEDVEIDLTLSYQAANNKTVESLAGVRLDHLTLDPKDGQWPLDEPDPALVEKIDARQVEWLEH